MIPNFEDARLSWEGPELFFSGQDYASEVLRDLRIEHGHWSGLEWRPTRDGAPEPRTFVVDAEHELFPDTSSDWHFYASMGSPDGQSAVSECQLKGSGEMYWCLIARRDMSITPLESWSRDGMGPLGWTEDSRSVYWRTGDEVYRLPIDGGDRELVFRLPPGLEDCQVRPGVEPAELICIEREFTAQLFLVENVDPQVN
jgi:hypothetical protein